MIDNTGLGAILILIGIGFLIFWFMKNNYRE